MLGSLVRVCQASRRSAAAALTPAVHASSSRSPLQQYRQYTATAPAGNEAPYAVYASYRMYKGKSSLSVSAISPTFRSLPGANGGHALSVDRPGVIMLEFVPTMGERQFDYNRKQRFALSASECGEIISKAGTGQDCTLIHDPQKFRGMNSIDASIGGGGGVGGGGGTKRVAVSRMRDDNGFFFNFQSNEEKISVPVTAGEFVVMRQLMLHSLPHLVGFDAAFSLAPNSSGDGGGEGFAAGGGYTAASGMGGGGSDGNNNRQVFNPFDSSGFESDGGGGSSNNTGSGKDGKRASSNWLDEL